MQEVFFSIVTAVKDGLDFFRETAPTVLQQTHKNFEWLIVDDASSEPLGDYVKSLNDPRIRYFRNEQGLGQTKSLNRAIRESRGDWIARVDGDDLNHVERLARTAAEISRTAGAATAPRLFFSDYDVIHEDGQFVAAVKYSSPIPEAFYTYLLEKNNPLAHATVTFFKRAPNGETYFYDENLRNAQDYALWKRICCDYERRFALLQSSLLQYRLVHQSLSVAGAKEQAAELRAIRQSAATMLAKPAETLLPTARSGMYAFRVLYYRFVGHAQAGKSFSLRDDWHWLAIAMRYPKNIGKGFLFGFFRPVRGILLRILFRGIYA